MASFSPHANTMCRAHVQKTRKPAGGVSLAQDDRFRKVRIGGRCDAASMDPIGSRMGGIRNVHYGPGEMHGKAPGEYQSQQQGMRLISSPVWSVSMTEHMQQRTRQQNQVGHGGKDVACVSPKEIGSKHGQAHTNDQARAGSKKFTKSGHDLFLRFAIRRISALSFAASAGGCPQLYRAPGIGPGCICPGCIGPGRDCPEDIRVIICIIPCIICIIPCICPCIIAQSIIMPPPGAG